MPRWHFVSLVVSVLLSLLPNTCWSQPTTGLTIEALSNSRGWVIVENHVVKGHPMTIGKVGTTLDPSERVASQLFFGGVDLTNPLYPLQTPIAGYVSVEFCESETGRPFVAISSIDEGRSLTHIVRVKSNNINVLRRYLGVDSDAVPVSADLVDVISRE